MKTIDLTNVQEVQDERLCAGGYVCVLETVTDVPAKEYLKIEYDIAEGNFKGYYSDLFSNRGFWGGTFYRSYKEKALSFFKGFITAVEKSNYGYKWNNDETSLNNKKIGLVLGEEEYRANDGSVKKRLYVHKTLSVDDIHFNKFTVPPLKTLQAGSTPTVVSSHNGTNNSSQAEQELSQMIDILGTGDLPF